MSINIRMFCEVVNGGDCPCKARLEYLILLGEVKNGHGYKFQMSQITPSPWSNINDPCHLVEVGLIRSSKLFDFHDVGYFPCENWNMVVVDSHGAKVRGGLKWKKVLQISIVPPTRTYWWQWHVHGRLNEKWGHNVRGVVNAHGSSYKEWSMAHNLLYGITKKWSLILLSTTNS